MEEYLTYYDVESSETVLDCVLKPTCVNKEEQPWLYVRSNKYKHIDYTKVGKWMLFVNKESIDDLWVKIKSAVQTGNLHSCKVSTTSTSDRVHAVMIYTKDYTDLDDVINVLNYLEESGIKSPNTVIRYKTDEMTRAGVYARNKQKASIYSSDTIRRGSARIAKSHFLCDCRN